MVGLLIAGPGSAALADERTALRSGMALKIFPRVVAVDSEVADKLTDERRIHLTLVYDADLVGAKRFRDRLAQDVEQIRQWPVEVSVARAVDLGSANLDSADGNTVPSAVLIVEPLGDAQFADVLKFGALHHRMVFSPFPGDVERGATAGLDVGVRVAPYFNQTALAAAAINIDPQILKVSKIYE
jgi:hypothetical protein